MPAQIQHQRRESPNRPGLAGVPKRKNVARNAVDKIRGGAETGRTTVYGVVKVRVALVEMRNSRDVVPAEIAAGANHLGGPVFLRGADRRNRRACRQAGFVEIDAAQQMQAAAL